MDQEFLKQLDEIQLSRCLPFLRKYYQKLRGKFKDFQELVKENLKPELRVLDAGCGDGQWGEISQLISSHPFVVGIDESEESLKKNTTIKQLFKGDLHQLPFGSSGFDLVICRSVFEHLADPKKVIAEFKRVLSDQGRVIVYTQNRSNPVMFLSSIMPVWLRKILKIIIMRKDCDEGTYKAFYKCNTKSNFRRLFRKEGFKEVKFIRHGQCPGYWKNSLFLNFFLIFEKLTDWKRLNFFKAHIVVLYEKIRLAGDSVPLPVSRPSTTPENILLLGFGFYLRRDNGDKNFWLSLSKELSIMLDKLVIVSVNSPSVKFEREKNIYLYNVQSPFHRKKNNGKGLSFQFLMNSSPWRVLERSAALLKLIPFLKKLIKLHNIQVIHLMDNFGFLTGLVKLFFPNLKIYATGITYNTHSFPSRLYSFYQKMIFGSLDKVVISSNAYKEKLIEHNFSREKLKVIRWGIPVSNEEERMPENGKTYRPNKVILWTGFAQQIKKESFYLSLSIAKNIIRRNHLVDFIFAFKPECFDQEYENFREEHIQVLITKPENFQNLLPEVDLLLAPIDNYSSTVAPPLTWIECMSLGIPVISTPVPGVDEILIHNQTGFVAKSKQELEELIERVLEERDLLTKVSTRAKEWVRENYNLKDIAGDYLKLWREDGRTTLSR